MSEVEIVTFLKSEYPMEGPAKCAKRLDLSLGRIKYLAKKHGLSMCEEGISQLFTRRDGDYTKYSVDPTQFFDVTTPEVAYILGMIWADGSIRLHVPTRSHSVCVYQNTSDMSDIAKVLDKTGRWNYYDRHRDGGLPSTTANISNKPLVKYLRKLGYESKATGSADAVLSTIPDHLKPYWFRGLFDGDGNLYVCRTGLRKGGVRVNISSDYDQDWSYLKKLCERLKIEYGIMRNIQREEALTGRRHRNSCFTLSRYADVCILMNYIYQGRELDGIGLNRKWIYWKTFRDTHMAIHGNRYAGVTESDNQWLASILVKWGVPKRLMVGLYASEQEAYDAQQNKMREMGLTSSRELYLGLQFRRV